MVVISQIIVEIVKSKKAKSIVGLRPSLSDTGPIISWKNARDRKYPEIKISNYIDNLVCGDISSKHKELISKELKDTSISFLDQNINF